MTLVVMASCKVLCKRLSAGTQETISKYEQFPYQHMNLGPSRYKTTVLTTRPQCFVKLKIGVPFTTGRFYGVTPCGAT